MRIGVAGITGRMGQLVAEEVVAAGAALTGGTCLRSAPVAPGVIRYEGIAALADACDAVIDFTHASAVMSHAAATAAAGCNWILGTTGLAPADQAAVNVAALAITVVQAANFSPGVNLVLALARQLGAALPADAYDAEILETHHRQKVDAPSGTALALGEALAQGRQVRLQDVRLPPRDGHTGPRRAGGIGFAALRAGQIVGEHSLILTAADEQIELRHTAFDRRSFARGAVRAALWTAQQKPGRYSMMDVLGMETRT